MKLVHWPLMGGLLHLVQRGRDRVGPQPAQAPARCTKHSVTAHPSTASVPITILLYILLCDFNVVLPINPQLNAARILKLWSLFSICHKLMRRSSADRYVAPSLFTEMELMWYVWALANTRRGLASTINSIGLNTGTRSDVSAIGSTGEPISSRRLKPSVRFRRSDTFHSFTVLSGTKTKLHKHQCTHGNMHENFIFNFLMEQQWLNG